MKAPHSAHRLSHGLVLLYEDKDIIAVDKPAGLLSIAAGTEREKTCYWILAEYLRHKGEKRRPAVVHRLDRDTSGVMIFAKSEQVKKKLMEHWDEAVTERRYVALAEGALGDTEGIIDAPLGEDAGGRVIVQQGGKRAVTHWKLLKAGNGFSLLALELETGRRNQIRAHLHYIGHPVAGDKKYAARTDPVKRLCLHAEKIAFKHPKDGKPMEFVSPVPVAMSGAVKGK
ncbi:MAG: RluA family pseudouridine synthase [Treponema sp.]|jgi:23S rRNA pseudouridine1911/1915/1917 synthase|nr:RluA family pseudouridine synthase [Treponema sp.]